MDKNNYCVIMAGGIGSRFWPLSRTERPKQFLDILGTGETLLQQTFNRLTNICLPENVLIVTNKIYKELVLAQLPEIKEDQVLLEPARRNTAPCIAYANAKILKRNPEAKIIVAPSDHLILKEQAFIDKVNQGLKFVSENNALLTLGIKPNRPDTGYGYIQINSNEKESCESSCVKVKTFTEKPDLEMAKFFVESGEFYWNSGIFIWSLKTINQAFDNNLKEVSSLFEEGMKFYDTPDENNFIEKTYAECRNISIDYGLMEKADNVFVLCADIGWSDLGTWGSLYQHVSKNENGNGINGKNVLTYDTTNSIVNVPDNKLVVLQGLDDYIVVESDDILLVCKKKEEQQIRQIVNDVKIKKGESFV